MKTTVHTAACAAALAAALFAAAPACAQKKGTFSGTVVDTGVENYEWLEVDNGKEKRLFDCGNYKGCGEWSQHVGKKIKIYYVHYDHNYDDALDDFIERIEWLGTQADGKLAQARAAAASPSAKNAAQINSLGVWHERGLHGLPKNAEKAFEYYQLAAEYGNALAMHNLGDLYRQGKGVPHNGAAAFEWYQKAAQAGHAIGLEDMGDCYLDGIGVAQNRDEAVRLYRQAAKRGRKSATQKLHRLGE